MAKNNKIEVRIDGYKNNTVIAHSDKIDYNKKVYVKIPKSKELSNAEPHVYNKEPNLGGKVNYENELNELGD